MFLQLDSTRAAMQTPTDLCSLQKVANTLNKTALLYQGVAARHGGEEFIILLNRLSDEQSAEVDANAFPNISRQPY